GPPRADDGAVGHLVAERRQHVIGGTEYQLALLRQAAGRGLQNESLQVAAPQARIDHVGARADQGGDFSAVLTGAELRQKVRLEFDVRIKLSCSSDEVGPAILTPGAVLRDG